MPSAMLIEINGEMIRLFRSLESLIDAKLLFAKRRRVKKRVPNLLIEANK